MSSNSKYSRNDFTERKPRPSTVTVPERASPAVKLVFAEMRRQGQTYDAVEAGSGVNRPTIKAWRIRNVPTLQSLAAVLGFLGWDFLPVPSERALPASVIEALKPIAALLDLTMPEAIQLAFEVAYRAQTPAEGDQNSPDKQG